MTGITLVCPACDTLNRVPPSRLAEAPICGACHKKLFTGEPLTVDEAGLARHVRHDGIPVLVDVWAKWCGPCRTMAPHFQQAAAVLEPRMRLLKLDADSAPETMAKHGISSIPTLLFYQGGQMRARQAGAMSAAQIVNWARQTVVS